MALMTCVRFYIGKLDRDGAAVPVEAQQEVIHLLTRVTGGATIYHTEGVWEGSSEASFVAEVLAEQILCHAEVERLALLAAVVCNQTAVLYTIDSVLAGFASPKREA